MAQSAVLAGRTAADLCRNVFVALLMTGVGYAVGLRVRTNVLSHIAAFGLLLLFSYALAWRFATVGLNAPNGETAQLMSFPILMPLTFASSAFVLVDRMPGWLQPFARNQPLSVVTDAARALMVGGDIERSFGAATPQRRSKPRVVHRDPGRAVAAGGLALRAPASSKSPERRRRVR